jgi:hypothetical protein
VSRVATVVDQHLVSHPLPGSNLINALICAADRSGFNADLHIEVTYTGLGFVIIILQAVFGMVEFLE